MDKSPVEQLEAGLTAVGVRVAADVPERLWAWAGELLKWNQKVNLTAITRVPEVVEKHLVDSLAVLPEVGEAGAVLDLGAGAGLPGIPLAIARPGLSVTLVDAVAKKVMFMKNAIARAGLAGRVRAEHIHLNGAPEQEGLTRTPTLISRAFRDVAPWLELAAAYRAPGGRIIAMVGQQPPVASWEGTAARLGLRLVSERRYHLPVSGDPRGVMVFAE